MKISENPEKKREACLMLQKKAAQTGKVPCKSDFSPEDVVFIKAHLGPWPNALASAGLKEKKKTVHHEENRRRKSRQKRSAESEAD